MTALALCRNTPEDVYEALLLFSKEMLQFLPPDMPPARMQRAVTAAVTADAMLCASDPVSLFGSMLQLCILGLEPDTPARLVTLRPLPDDTCVVVGRYAGYVELARRHRIDVHAHVVREPDQFRFQYGKDPMIEHVPHDDLTDRERMPISHAYAVARTADGAQYIAVLHQRQPSVEVDPSVACKDAVRELWSTLCVSPDMERLASLDDAVNDGTPQMCAWDEGVLDALKDHVTQQQFSAARAAQLC